jgi:hypothetical protein
MLLVGIALGGGSDWQTPIISAIAGLIGVLAFRKVRYRRTLLVE